MDRFPEDYYLHNLPLLLLSGLGAENDNDIDPSRKAHNLLQEGGFRIKIDAPRVQGNIAQLLQESFRDQDASNLPWHSQSLTSRNGRFFKITSVGRAYALPPRKAPPPPHSPLLSASVGSGNPPPQLILHSPLSPLTPSSPLYPDGIFSPLWILKHQSRLPCAFISFFSLASDPNSSSLEDNKVKSEISSARSVITSTNYRTRLVVVLIGDGHINPSELDDRFSNIRRSSGLDSKSIYFIPFNASPVEVKEFVNTVLSSIHASCVDYYRDLSKHARRKRSRNVVPQPTVQPGSAHVLSLPGWNVRYEFKLGVFAEFRQEMDAACRNYETAYEGIFGAEIMHAIPVWSPRFNEARLLADIIALRTLRCLLWTDQGSTAVKSWITHRERMKDLVNRRTKGTENYAWEAWLSMWATAMADLISRSQYPLLSARISDSSDLLPVFAVLEKSLVSTERAIPWELLHHEGYWLEIARKATVARRTWVQQLPEEERQPPGRSPAGVAASKSQSYNTYLALEPYREYPLDGSQGYDYQGAITATLTSAIEHFAKRGQLRKTEILKLEMALESLGTQSWKDAVTILQPLWSSVSWRAGGWWTLLQHIGWAMHDCAVHLQDSELSIQLLWELSSNVFEQKGGLNYNLGGPDSIPSSDGQVASVSINMDEALSPLVPRFAFSSHNVSVGTPLTCQLSLEARMGAEMPPIPLGEIKVVFEGALKPIYLVSQPSAPPPSVSSQVELFAIVLQDSSKLSSPASKRSSTGLVASEIAYADLTIHSGQTRIFQFEVTPREAGELSVASITLILNRTNMRLAATTSSFEHSTTNWWEMKGGAPILRSLGQESNAYNCIDVQPKPPKLQIHAPGLRKAYYVNETIHVEFELLNEESEDASVMVEARMISPIAGAAKAKWTYSEVDDKSLHESVNGVIMLKSQDLGTIKPGHSEKVSLLVNETIVAVDHELEIVAKYRLANEPETISVKSLTVDIGVIRPFEANYEFLPRLSREPWPSFFEAPPTDIDPSTTALGLKHQYTVTANLYSFAAEPLVIEAILLTASKIVGGAVCFTSTGIVHPEGNATETSTDNIISSKIDPDQTEKFDFDLSIQKLVLGDRNIVGIDLALQIGWRREDSNEVNTTVLEVPKLTAPMAEPRVMLTVSPLPQEDLHIYRLDFMLENPSMHFLTFNISMDTSEKFAFSGPKSSVLSLVPMSRNTVSYRIMPSTEDAWIGVNLNVVDAYFGQTLKILPGGDGVKVDKKGNVFIKV
ncbi:uncharacterized protein A1O9_11109 [Exophiala aquamarina CBS 119918]|uniref:Trafficking protein particle complex subunit 11 domain-containing protein n=1 Tax=Exophiala aquamarina CBS 119918 TaxID=1182545 RepID=A0A072NZ46_9EURO|nr:uncharacterized protein A1O9_11109 [Exophiala aquamarina CBS 119918]KEF52692.1 hypothetical protein A1O9_11109 [Exophiala aquamarina CBS 119918]